VTTEGLFAALTPGIHDGERFETPDVILGQAIAPIRGTIPWSGIRRELELTQHHGMGSRVGPESGTSSLLRCLPIIGKDMGIMIYRYLNETIVLVFAGCPAAKMRKLAQPLA